MILQVGNKLGEMGKSESFMETLDKKLRSTYHIETISSVRNIFLKLLHMNFKVVWQARKIELVIIHSYSTLAFYYTLTVAFFSKILGIPYIVELHGGAYPNRIKATPTLCRYVFRNASEIVSPSGYLKEAVETFGFPVTYIPNFINLENYNYKIPSKQIRNILWVRAFDKIYNPMLAPKILSHLNNSELKLTMVGPIFDDTFDSTKIVAKELKVTNQITYTGQLTNMEWVALAANFDLFINTTNYDNRPISVLEAMALGLPVVSTNVGGLTGLINSGTNGFLVEPDNAKVFANAIQCIIDDAELANSISANARKYAEDYSWLRLKDVWFDLIERNKRSIKV